MCYWKFFWKNWWYCFYWVDIFEIMVDMYEVFVICEIIWNVIYVLWIVVWNLGCLYLDWVDCGGCGVWYCWIIWDRNLFDFVCLFGLLDFFCCCDFFFGVICCDVGDECLYCVKLVEVDFCYCWWISCGFVGFGGIVGG